MRIWIYSKEGKTFTTSLKIAEYFGIEHFEILKKIESLPRDYLENDFRFFSNINRVGIPGYTVTKLGFKRLTKKLDSNQKQRNFLNEFIKKENDNKEKSKKKDAFCKCYKELMDSINTIRNSAEKYNFSNYQNLITESLFGVKSKELRHMRAFDDNTYIFDYITAKETQKCIDFVPYVSKWIREGINYKTIKKKVAELISGNRQENFLTFPTEGTHSYDFF